MTNQAKYFHTFNLVNEIGPIAFKKLLSYFSSLENAWTAQISEFKKAQLNNLQIQKIKKLKNTVNPDQEYEKVKSQGIEIITILNKDYPGHLKEIYQE